MFVRPSNLIKPSFKLKESAIRIGVQIITFGNMQAPGGFGHDALCLINEMHGSVFYWYDKLKRNGSLQQMWQIRLVSIRFVSETSQKERLKRIDV